MDIIKQKIETYLLKNKQSLDQFYDSYSKNGDMALPDLTRMMKDIGFEMELFQLEELFEVLDT